MALVPDVLVDLVDDGDESVSLADARDLLELVAAQHAAGRIARRVEEEQTRAPADRALEPREIDRIVGLAHRDEARRDAGQHTGGQVVLVPGLEDERFVARLGQAENGATSASETPQVTVISVAGSTLIALNRRCFSARASRKVSSPQGYVYWWWPASTARRKRREELRRRIEVRQSLREIDAADLGAEPRHLADHRLLERPGAAGERDLPPPGGHSLAGGSRGGAHRRTRLSHPDLLDEERKRSKRKHERRPRPDADADRVLHVRLR